MYFSLRTSLHLHSSIALQNSRFCSWGKDEGEGDKGHTSVIQAGEIQLISFIHFTGQSTGLQSTGLYFFDTLFDHTYSLNLLSIFICEHVYINKHIHICRYIYLHLRISLIQSLVLTSLTPIKNEYLNKNVYLLRWCGEVMMQVS